MLVWTCCIGFINVIDQIDAVFNARLVRAAHFSPEPELISDVSAADVVSQLEVGRD